MPYRIDPNNKKCVQKQVEDRWVKKGCSDSAAGAKDYLAVLNMRHAGVPEKKEKKGK